MHYNSYACLYNGNGGNIEGHNDILSATPQLWSVFSNPDYGYGRLIVHNQTYVYYEQYSAFSLLGLLRIDLDISIN